MKMESMKRTGFTINMKIVSDFILLVSDSIYYQSATTLTLHI